MSTPNACRLAGFLAGLALAALALTAWRVPAGARRLGADLQLSASPSGELAVAPSGVFVATTNLEPDNVGGGAVEGRLKVKNQTGTTLNVKPHALPSTADLDRLVELTLDVDGVELYRGPLGELRGGPHRPARLVPGQSAILVARAQLRPATGEDHRGRSADVPFQLRVEPAAG